jgi:hypothetical protein
MAGVQAGDGTMLAQIGHWLEYDEVAFAVLVTSIAIIALLILSM